MSSKGSAGQNLVHSPVIKPTDLIEGMELHPDSTCLENFPKLPLWIIEYVWAHKMMDIQQVVDPSCWPEVDSQPLSLEDSWRLRVASAKVYSIVKNRDLEHFEKVVGFLEATYSLLPKLVAPIKHMKIMFGVKTMLIMWMLREGRGMVDTVVKISQFFPSKLPQYQDQCNQHEMFLMRKNHLDFKALAQVLATDKDKLKDYIKNQMEEQYGEHYAQKVEDRLLHYLQKLETVLPGDTYIDKIMKKESPVTEEEKLLLEVVTTDSTNIATTLKKLLHCDVASCRLSSNSPSSAHGQNRMESSSAFLYASSSKALLKSVEAKIPLQFQSEVFGGGGEADQDVPKDRNDNDSDVSSHPQTKEDGEVDKKVQGDSSDQKKKDLSQRSSESVQESPSSPQFCSKHQRWVKSILQECPDECSEELLLQANVSMSPPLFQSSSSASSSQDLTPSDLIPCPPDQQQPPSQTSTGLQTTAAQTSNQASPKKTASDISQTEYLPQPSSSRDTQLPVVKLVDIASVGHPLHFIFKPHQTALNHLITSSNKQAASTSSPQVLGSPHSHTSGNNAILGETMKDSMYDQPNNVVRTNSQMDPVSRDASTSSSCQPQTARCVSKLSRKFGAYTSTRLNTFSQVPLTEQFEKAPTDVRTSCPLLPNFNLSEPLTKDVSTSVSPSGIASSVCVIPLCTEPSRQSIKPHPQTPNTSPFQSKTSSAVNSDCLAVRSETSRVRTDQLRLSIPSQAVLLQSKLLQPCVTLTRLSTQECYRVTKWKPSTRYVEPVVQDSNDDNVEDRREEEEEEEEEDAVYSFDLNLLYSSHSSSSDSDDSHVCDPDYKPLKRKT
ncbi:uncharacterized protein LOC131973500 [Centropristis striata]|uniref:uncharacterized protein LOC131973500 n=1 Tax=Centropristis striata TaxID=184440 RepID=UPI0027E1DC4F|nr:uncharacterized protein LOC131973500 [Centropristis striata]